MQLKLKLLTPEAIPAAYKRAEHFLWLNQPWESESVCRDILRVEKKHQAGLVLLIQSLTEQFGPGDVRLEDVLKYIPQLDSEYERHYYTGMVFSCWAKAQHRDSLAGAVTSDWYLEALRSFQKAEAIRPPGNDDAILAWNSCVRILHANEQLKHRFTAFGPEDRP